MAGWILGAIAILLLWALIARARTYARLLSDAHFLAIGCAAPALRKAALDQITTIEEAAVRDASDARILKTASGLAIVYTVARQESEFVHHCSVSVPGEQVAQRALDFFLSFVLLLLGLPIGKARFWISAGNVHHAQLQLCAEEQAAVAAQSPLDTSDASLFALRAQASEARPRA